MKTLLFLLLLPGLAFGQLTQFVTQQQFATRAAMTLYVDPLGSDSTACTSSGTGACLTLAGAYAKLPRFIKHTVTINVAANAYATAFTAPDIVISSGITVSVVGTISTFTPATGSASGTATSSAAGSTTGPATLTQSGQTWTVNDLRGRFVSITSGVLSGQILPINSNTATTISFPTTVATGNATYSIVTAGSTFISASSAAISGPNGAGTFRVTNVRMENTAGTGLFSAATAATTLTNVQLVGGVVHGFQLLGGAVTMTRSYLSGSFGGFSTGTTALNSSIYCSSCSNNVFRGGSSPAFQGNFGPPNGQFISAGIFESNTTAAVLNLSGQGTATGIWVTCTTPASGIGIGSTVATSSTPVTQSSIALTNARVTSCAKGVEVYGSNSWVLGTIAFDTVTSALLATKRGSLDLLGGTPTFTTVTNEIQIDGTNYTLAALIAAGPPALLSSGYGSVVIR